MKQVQHRQGKLCGFKKCLGGHAVLSRHGVCVISEILLIKTNQGSCWTAVMCVMVEYILDAF